ncbi:MAG: coproporphyrinogen III oxidase [Acidiphilium sp. 37-67-22]|nr:MAG: coproporphyrinogen III oxidase [Acidiphilium sp. 37-67-22]HQT72982.1 radical SAM family heme chaperone HemW [Acidiphilium sp.]
MTPLALYIHWPFCKAKCPYCDFNSHVRERIPEQRIVAALLAELEYEAARLGPRRLTSIFFGGGTPSLMAPDSVAALIGRATSLFAPAPDLEITLEANPTSIEAGRFRAYREAGVNRVSIGVQSLNDDALRFLGREHGAAEALEAVELGRAIFPRLSFDLIYARPGQTLAAWRAELGAALAVGLDHLSLYQLTIEPGTRFATAHARGDFALPEDDDAAALYDATAEEAARFGLAPYEISNYAKPGEESRHNLAYWRYRDYAGIGAGAHGRICLGETLLATRRHRAPEEWAARVEASGHGSTEEVEIGADERAREALLMGLRLAEGIDRAAYAARTGRDLLGLLDPDMTARAIEAGYLDITAARVTATYEGRKRLDSLLAALLG